MPAKKKEEAVKEEKKTPAKKSPAKKAPAKKETAKKAAEKKVIIAAKPTDTKNRVLSKGKTRKMQVHDRFNGKKYHLGVGKRKSATALVRLHEKGDGQMFVNNKDLTEYFYGTLIENALLPLSLTGKEKEFNITIKVTGGGTSSQAEAVRHGIARALVEMNPDLRLILKKAGLITRDARVKERKKPGLKGARRAPQWAKR